MTDDDARREVELRSYLLGSVSPERQEEIDQQVIADAEVHAELRATEDDLIHAYLAGELSDGDRERFESHFLASPRRRERVAFVRALVSAVGRTQPGQPAAAMPAPSAAAPSRSRLVVGLPWAAALVVGLAAGGWSIGERRLRERDRAAAQEEAAELRRQLAEREAHRLELEQRVRAGTEAGGVSTRVLRSGVERGAEGGGAIDVKGEWVRLRVLLAHDLHVPSYRASLQTADGREIYSLTGLPDESGSAGRVLDLMVPARLRRPGAYVLSIQRDAEGPPEELTATTFVVR